MVEPRPRTALGVAETIEGGQTAAPLQCSSPLTEKKRTYLLGLCPSRLGETTPFGGAQGEDGSRPQDAGGGPEAVDSNAAIACAGLSGH